jgi:four helix bundle protein
VKDFRDLEVWKKAHELTLAVYKNTEDFPRHELFGLTSQMRRCSVSITANIAEGCGRSNNGDFHRFLQNAMGSAVELEYHVLLAKDLGYLGAHTAVLAPKVIAVKQMLTKLSRKVAIDRFQRP